MFWSFPTASAARLAMSAISIFLSGLYVEDEADVVAGIPAVALLDVLEDALGARLKDRMRQANPS